MKTLPHGLMNKPRAVPAVVYPAGHRTTQSNKPETRPDRCAERREHLRADCHYLIILIHVVSHSPAGRCDEFNEVRRNNDSVCTNWHSATDILWICSQCYIATLVPLFCSNDAHYITRAQRVFALKQHDTRCGTGFGQN